MKDGFWGSFRSASDPHRIHIEKLDRIGWKKIEFPGLPGVRGCSRCRFPMLRGYPAVTAGLEERTVVESMDYRDALFDSIRHAKGGRFYQPKGEVRSLNEIHEESFMRGLRLMIRGGVPRLIPPDGQPTTGPKEDAA